MARRWVNSLRPFLLWRLLVAVRVGDHVFVSGTTARPDDLGADAYIQAKSALAIIAKAMTELGAGFADVVRTSVFIVDMADIDQVTRACGSVRRDSPHQHPAAGRGAHAGAGARRNRNHRDRVRCHQPRCRGLKQIDP